MRRLATKRGRFAPVGTMLDELLARRGGKVTPGELKKDGVALAPREAAQGPHMRVLVIGNGQLGSALGDAAASERRRGHVLARPRLRLSSTVSLTIWHRQGRSGIRRARVGLCILPP